MVPILEKVHDLLCYCNILIVDISCIVLYMVIFAHRSFNQDDDEPVKMKKHKVIAQVFAKRQAFNRAGRISISFHSTHDDPVGK